MFLLRFKVQHYKQKHQKEKKIILYFTPNFCSTVETNIRKRFVEIVNRNFGLAQLYHKLQNKIVENIVFVYEKTNNFAQSEHIGRKTAEVKLCNGEKKRVVDDKCLLANMQNSLRTISNNSGHHKTIC